MSVQDEIARIAQAKSDIANAIEEKGVEVGDGTSIDGMAKLIRDIYIGETNVIESVSVNNIPLTIENKNVNIDLTEYAMLNNANAFSLFQTFAGTMPSANTAVVNTVLIGQSVYVMGGKNTSGGWLAYSLLYAGRLDIVGNTSNRIYFNATGTTPSITAKDATNGARTIYFPTKGGTLATQEWVEENGGGGTKIYNHTFTWNSEVYHIYSLSNYDLTDMNVLGIRYHIGKLLSINVETDFISLYGLTIGGMFFNFFRYDINMSYQRVETLDPSEITNYSITEV